MNLLRKIYNLLIVHLSIKRKALRLIKSNDPLKVLSSVQTISAIIQNKYSVSRFGDGEFSIIYQWLNNQSRTTSKFQNFSPDLAQKLYEILNGKLGSKNLMVCIPEPFIGKNLKLYIYNSRIFWNEVTLLFFEFVHKALNPDNIYGDTNFTRFYITKKNRKKIEDYILLIKLIWHDRDIIFVEGRYSRLGVGNDLFDNAKSIRRILCPEKNAFDSYEAILKSIVSKAKKDDLVLIALGMTATVLAADLSTKGIQAIDLGHIDIEYEWFKMGVTEKVPIPGKYTNEAKENIGLNTAVDPLYESQIIDRIY